MRRVRVPALSTRVIAVPPDLAHYLRDVLRLRDGATVQAFDGAGGQAACRLERTPDGDVLRCGPIQQVDPPREVHLVLAIARGPAMDTALQMATEAGATEVHLVRATRSPPTGDRTGRWMRKMDSAARQCGRADVPRLHPEAALPEVLRRLSQVPLALASPGSTGRPDRCAGIIVGPEGGLTDAESAQCAAAGATPISLGPHVLRVETAVAVGVALVSLST